jgi:hypothetical protein
VVHVPTPAQHASASGKATSNSPPHARLALRAAKHQTTAAAYTAKLANMPVNTAWAGAMGKANAATLASAATP